MIVSSLVKPLVQVGVSGTLLSKHPPQKIQLLTVVPTLFILLMHRRQCSFSLMKEYAGNISSENFRFLADLEVG